MSDLLTVLGIFISVVGLVAGFFFARKVYRRSQQQRVSSGSSGIQSGPDTNIKTGETSSKRK